ncbi:unnamed protein product, partial [Medioppia subpectinata]
SAIGSVGQFTINSNTNQFIKDGQPFRYVSGALHYFKVPAVLWLDRMVKYKMAGLNVIQTYNIKLWFVSYFDSYIEWTFHEPEEGVFRFDGDYDIIKYLQTAHDLGLLINLRTGPYIDAERDLGGLPYWLLSKNPKMKLRTSDPTYLSAVDKWFSLLLPKLAPMLYINGGPVIMVQIENEYGSYNACDFEYVDHLRDFHIKHFGREVQLFTTDGNADYFLKCGKIDGVFATIDFGPGSDIVQSFAAQRAHQQFGPYVNSEYYTGWIDHWEEPHSTVGSAQVANTLDKMLAFNASLNLYPLCGGTSFGFGAGANQGDGGQYIPCITSYDFNAPLTESGDPTQKYFDVRKVIGKYLPLPNGTLPAPAPKMETKPIVMKPVLNIYDIIKSQTPIESTFPMTFEELRVRDGFILYSTNIAFIPSDPAVLTVKGLKDRAQVFVNKVYNSLKSSEKLINKLKYAGTLSRTRNLFTIGLDIEFGSQLDLLVENQGRLCYGNVFGESKFFINLLNNKFVNLKGITSNVTIGPQLLKNWKHYLLFKNWTENVAYIQYYSDIYSSNQLPIKKSSFERIPGFYFSEFVLSDNKDYPLDTFLRLDGWRKGLAFLNGFNLGRYWTVGPQLTLYTPKHLFNAFPKPNKLIVFELENTANDRSVQFVKQSVLNATTPYD